MGVDKAKEYAKEADLIIYVVDASKNLDENDEKIFDLIYDKRTVILFNKSDLDTVVTEEMIRERISTKGCSEADSCDSDFREGRAGNQGT